MADDASIRVARVVPGPLVDAHARPSGASTRLTVHARSELTAVATGRFAVPSSWIEFEVAADARLLGCAFTQFARPVVGTAALDFDFHPAPNLHSPAALGLLLATCGDHTSLLAPLTGVHEQIISVADGALRWGWHGDLDHIPAGFESTAGLYTGASATEVLELWVADLDVVARRWRLDEQPLTSHLSYWTDNGAAYWYRTEAGRTIGATVAEAVRGLRDHGVPVRAVELDSWFYPHEILRPITTVGYPEEVPPTGMRTWTPRPDAFDAASTERGDDAIEQWARSLEHPPLVLHARHIAPTSPYLDEGDWWVEELAAHPVDPEFFRRWFVDAARWGACCIEQDWLLMYWFGVRALRAHAGRALHWQRALDRLAGEHDIGLLWCMATPADLIEAARLPHVVAVRTSDDYRFAADPAVLWVWFLTVNRLAGSLGLPAFKDVFFSQTPTPGADAIDGDPHAELEALLASLSAGPVGLGDRIGHTDRDVVLRTCNDDGSLRHVDRPVALIDACLFGEPARGERLAWASTTATTDGGVWTYVVAINAADDGVHIDDTLALADLGIDGSRSVLDWRRRASARNDRLAATLRSRDWAFFVIAPPGADATSGDLSRYVTNPRSTFRST
jgi:hypothetical protein